MSKNINRTTNARVYASPSVVIRVQSIKHYPFQSLKHFQTEKLFISPVTHTWNATLAKEKENIMTSSSREKS
jgi:hypothetical protein